MSAGDDVPHDGCSGNRDRVLMAPALTAAMRRCG
jgi:hypothetical protein